MTLRISPHSGTTARLRRRAGGRLFHLREALVPPGSLSLALLIGWQRIGVSAEATVGRDAPYSSVGVIRARCRIKPGR